jgi:ferric-dicitrate binding protein FerR (iron transport regulator)
MTDEERATAELLRLAGAPADPAPERTSRVRDAVHQEWRASLRPRSIRRSAYAATAALAAAAAIAVAVRLALPQRVPPAADRIVAMGQQAQGRPYILRRARQADIRHPLAASTPIHSDDEIVTDAVSRAALQSDDGSSVRIDRASRVRFVAPGTIEVIEGAAYVATVDGSRGFEVRTPVGVVRDVGTQFEVRLIDSSLRVRVRAGGVEIWRGGRVTKAMARTETVVTTSGITVRELPSSGPDWAWMASLTRPFAIEGRTLRAFLEHLAREQGYTLRYADATVAEAAGRIILHGSVEGLQPGEALDVVLATSGLRYRLRAGDLLVSGTAAAQ